MLMTDVEEGHLKGKPRYIASVPAGEISREGSLGDGRGNAKIERKHLVQITLRSVGGEAADAGVLLSAGRVS
jgi:hypothetical protein